MLLAAARYGYPNAKVRGLRSRKLSLQDYHFLRAANDLTTFLSYLATTSYGSFLPARGQGGHPCLSEPTGQGGRAARL